MFNLGKSKKNKEQEQNKEIRNNNPEHSSIMWEDINDLLTAISYSDNYSADIDRIQELQEWRPEVKYYKRLMVEALKRNVTDIHFEPEEGKWSVSNMI